jgi:hypothetical protein
MKRREGILLAAGAVLVLALLASFELGYIPVGQGRTSTTCPGCNQQEPVVDVIMPVLGNAANATNPNFVVNMTAGETRAFEVDLYPTVTLNFSMGFRAILASYTAGGTKGDGGLPNATFRPDSLYVTFNEKGVSTMTVTVPGNAAPGSYDAIVSATNVDDSAQVWGLYFEIQVS